ncbi:MAG: FAD-dependent oxidoreductase [Thermoanaerobacteraceae bacterium]|nr:FAD-dependent oxidoreductase [Thermoanaerobacteraceae bacterium]
MQRFILIFLTLLLLVTGCNFSNKSTDFDVIVIGATPEGIAASISASRNKLKTLLVDSHDKVGGLYTRAGLNTIDMNYGPDKELLTRGIFDEFYRAIGGDSFDIKKAENVFNEMLAKARVKLLLNADIGQPVIEDNRLTGITINGIVYNAQRFIDATEDADIAAASGVPYTYGQEDIGHPDRAMAPTLVFKLSGVDWNGVKKYLNTDPSKNTGANNRSAWGYSEMYRYKPKDPDIRVRGLNMGRQDDGTVLVNSLLIYGVDVLDADSRRAAIEKALKELPDIIEYMNELPGLENASLAGVMDDLYVRESRHIIGEYRLTLDDVLENRYFKDAVVLGSYPVDIQSFGPDSYGLVMGKPAVYAIPFRCLVPKKIDNLLVVGRSASYDSLAAGSARVVPVGMGEGQAAGAAAKISIDKNMTFREMAYDIKAIEQLQEKLKNQGAYIKEYNTTPDIVSSPYYPYIKELRRYGYIHPGYSNNYRLDEIINYNEFVSILNQILSDHIKDYKWITNIKNDRPLRINDIKTLTLKYLKPDQVNITEMDEPITHKETYKLLYDILLTIL